MNKNIKQVLITIFFIKAFVISAFSQISLPSPDVQSMLRFGQNDVSQYSGGIDIGVDIYNIESFINIPVKLSYTGSHGILVREHASRVGLGWTLNPSCVVTKVVRGKHDADDKGFSRFYSYFNFDKSNYGEDFLNDYEPDLQYYSTFKSSGSFYVNKNGEFIKIPLSKVEIEGRFQESFGFFSITETDGTLYEYRDSELTSVYDEDKPGNKKYFSSSSFVTRILSSNRKDTIYFKYIDGKEQMNNYDNNGEPVFIDSENRVLGYPATITSNQIKLLDEIKWKNGVVKFIYKEGRMDLKYGKCLDEIVVIDNNGKVLRTCKFIYSYFSKNETISYDQGSLYKVEDKKNGSVLRLKLDKLIIYDKFKKDKQEYIFDYTHDVFLPERSSYSIDHWGYYNGEDNTTLNPVSNTKPNELPSSVINSNRDVNEKYAKAGVLTSITFPTGAKSEFVFESNSVSKASLISNKYIGKKFVHRNESTMLIEAFDPEKDRTVKLDLSNINLVGGLGKLKICTLNYPKETQGGTSDNVLLRIGSKQIGIPATSCNNPHFEYILPGVYDVVIRSNAKNIQRWDVSFEWIDANGFDYNGNVKVGGLRVAKIINYNEGKVVNERAFEYNDSLGVSTGGLIQEPEYIYTYNNAYNEVSFNQRNTDIKPSFDPSWEPLQNVFFSNNPIYPLRLAENSPVGYGKVTEYIKNNGKIESFFLTSNDISDYSNAVLRTPPYRLVEYYNNYGKTPYFPLAEKQSNDLIRGKIIRQLFYNERETHTYTLTKEIINKYRCYNISKNPFFSSTEVNYGLKIEGDDLSQYILNNKHNDSNDLNIQSNNINLYCQFINNNTTMFPKLKKSIKGQKIALTNSHFHGVDYFITSGIVLNDSIIVKDYYDSGVVENITKYTYNDEAQVIESVKTNGYVNKSIEYSYPNSTNLKEFYERNNVETPYLEVEKTNGKLTKAILKEYRQYNNDTDLLLPSKIKEGLNVNSNNEINYRDKMLFDVYDKKGRLLQVTLGNGITSSYIWSNESEKPIAVVQNAMFKNVFFNSFEEGSIDIDTCNHYTGTRSKKNGYNKVLKNLTPGKYVLSYWNYINNIWSYNKMIYDVTTDFEININGQIDDVCFFPLNGLLTTYAYKPLVGITSIISPNSNTIYYEYDNFYRLAKITDNNGMILNNYNYNYAGFKNIEKSKIFAKNNCKEGDVGCSLTYTVPAGTYTSIISQEAADMEAENDIKINGQNYVNTKGGCYYLNTASSTVNYLAAGGTKTVVVNSNTIWNATASDAWISLSPKTISGNADLSIACSANIGGRRIGTVRIESKTTCGNVFKNILVTQDTASYMNVDIDEIGFFYTSGSEYVKVKSGSSWSIVSQVGSFIHAIKEDEQTLRIECDKNIEKASRQGSVTISNGTQNITIHILQGPYDPNISPEL